MVRTFLTAAAGIVILLVAKQFPGPIGGFADWVLNVLGHVADEVTKYLREKGLV
jgi:hypothetical protein